MFVRFDNILSKLVTYTRNWSAIALSIMWLSLPPHCANAQGKFIQNLGQWDTRVIARAGIKSGAIFLCKDQIRYGFMDAKDVESLHADPYRTDTTYIHAQAFFLKWLNSDPGVRTTFNNQYPEYYNYFIGTDPSRWKSHVNAYSDIIYKNLYQGIDLEVNAEGSDLEYTYTVQPGTDPAYIQIQIQGAESVSIQDGDLYIGSQLISIIEKSPYAYQVINGKKVAVPCTFTLSNNNTIESFSFPKGYDDSKPLIIDPVVIFSTYSGSTADNWGFTATYDNLGNGYSGGVVFSTGFPATPGAFQGKYAGGTSYTSSPYSIDLEVMGYFARDVGILKYTPDGKNLVYATYLGGVKGNEQPHSMVVDKDYDLIVMGTTASSDFPVSAKAFRQVLFGKTDIFISKFSPDGSKLLASTLIGGTGFDGLNGIDSTGYVTKGFYTYYVPYAGTKLFYNYGDQFRGEVVVDSSDNVYVASSTMSSNFPTTSGSYQSNFGGGKQDGVAFKLDSNLSNLLWSTFLGGSGDDGAYSIQLDAHSEAFVCGGTTSNYFFPKDTGYQENLKGDVDGYICHINSNGTGIISSTYLGTPKYDQTYFVQLDQNENVYVYGQTESTSFPLKNAKYINPKSGNFITEFDYKLKNIKMSTVFGSGKGIPDISPTAFLVDKCNKIYISGWGGELFYPTLSRLQLVYNMPISNGAFQTYSPDSDAFYVAVFEKGMDTLLYGSYFGGSASETHVDGGTSRFDKNGKIYESVCASCGGHSDFPTTPGAWSRTNNSSNCNNLLFKLDLKISELNAAFITPQYSCLGVNLKITNGSTDAQSYLWDFGDGSPLSTDSLPQHYYNTQGTYKITLIVTNPNSCQYKDTLTKYVTVYKQSKASFNVQKINCSNSFTFMQTGESNTTSWYFGDGGYSDKLNGIHTYMNPGYYSVKLLIDSGTACVDSFLSPVHVTDIFAGFKDSFPTCHPNEMYFKDTSKGELLSYKWYLPFASTDTAKNTYVNFGNNYGTYPITLVVTDSGGCKDSIEKRITVSPTPTASFFDSLYPCTPTVALQNTSKEVNSFKWYFSDGSTSSSPNLVHQFPNDTIVTIKLVTDSGSTCPDSTIKTIKISYTKAGYKYSIDTCTGQVLFGNTSTGASSYTWKFNAKDSATGTNALYTYTQKGRYPVRLIAKSSAGCTDSMTQVVNIANSQQVLYIPNVFTPNGDAFNNTFKINGLDPCDTYELSIYNRWGQEFYHAVGKNFNWDGIYKGTRVPEGVYYYVFKGRKEGQLTGTVTVVY